MLTLLAVDPFHPFPHLLNKSLNVVVELDGNDLNTNLAVVQVPRILPRLLTYKAGEKGVPIHLYREPYSNARRFSFYVKVKGAYQSVRPAIATLP